MQKISIMIMFWTMNHIPGTALSKDLLIVRDDDEFIRTVAAKPVAGKVSAAAAAWGTVEMPEKGRT